MNKDRTALQTENAALRTELAHLRQQVAHNERMRLLVDAAPIGLVIGNLQGQCIESNRAMQTMLGYSEHELRDMSFTAFTHPDDLVLETPLVEAIMAGERSQYELQKRYIRKDGQIIDVHIRIAATRTPTGAVDFFIGVIEDITQRKQTEESLRESQQRLQFALEGSGDGTWDWNIITSEVIFSDRYLAILGYEPGELAPTRDSWATNIHPDDLSIVNQHLHAYLTGQRDRYAIEHRLRRKDGSWQWILSRGKIIARDEAGQPVRMTGTITDIAAQKQAEVERDALQQQIIQTQQARLCELSTPLIPISDSVMIMPLIGTIDSQRARLVLERLLEGVARQQADLVILDITGVTVVDTQVAQALIQAAQAVKLLGAQVMLTGIQPQIAQTLVHLGIDLRGIITHGTLQAGIASALGNTQRPA